MQALGDLSASGTAPSALSSIPSSSSSSAVVAPSAVPHTHVSSEASSPQTGASAAAASASASCGAPPQPPQPSGSPLRHGSQPEPARPLVIPAVAGTPSFYPQSLWAETRRGFTDTDKLTYRRTYRLPAHKRLIPGKYVEDPDLEDFSNPRYRGPGVGIARAPPRFAQMVDAFGSNRLPPPPPGHGPPPVYAVHTGPLRVPGAPQPTASALATPTTISTTTCSSTSGSFSTVGTSDYECDEDEDDEADGDGVRLPHIGTRCSLPRRSGGGNAGRAAEAASSARVLAQTVKQTYPVVEPIYSFSAASFYFPIYYGRASDSERADPRGLPQRINEELHPNDRADMPITSVSVQKDNLNRMALFKIGPGAVAFKVVITAFEAAGMKYTTSNSKFNILWAKRATPYTLASLNAYQKVNHFPGTWGIGRKDSLALNMSKMRRLCGEDAFDVVPMSFLIPRQEYELRADAERNPDTPEKPLIYILKPSASSCGRGIELCRGLPPMPRGGKQMVCQRYIGNPLLIFGRKFDLRLYCVVTSFDPLRIYLFDEGLVRFAAEKYPGPDKELDNIHMHLTNYSVNKTADLSRESNGKEYDSDDPMDIKWCISDFRKHLMTHHPLGLEAWTRIQRECDDVVIKAMLSVENDVIERIRYECRDTTGRNCFELFGLDLMADSDLKVRLIEVNIMPSLATGSNLDKAVKARMLAHMLTLVRAMPFRRNALPKRTRGRQRAPAITAAVRQPSRSRSVPRRSRDASPSWEGLRAVAAAQSSTADGGKVARSRGSCPARSRCRDASVDADDEEEEACTQGSAAENGNTKGGSPRGCETERAEVFVPHGAAADRPERIYRFGRHPLASARIIEKPLLTAFNDPSDADTQLSPYETLMLVEAEEELRCAGGFRRVFPDVATVHRYLPLFTHGVRRNNYVLISALTMQAMNKSKID